MIPTLAPQLPAALARVLAKAGTIVWNSPVGVFEFDQFAGGTGLIAATLQPRPRSRSQAGRHHRCHQQIRHRRQGELHLDGGGASGVPRRQRRLPAVAALEARDHMPCEGQVTALPRVPRTRQLPGAAVTAAALGFTPLRAEHLCSRSSGALLRLALLTLIQRATDYLVHVPSWVPADWAAC